MRRQAGFEIADYINTYYQGDDYTSKVMTDFAEYIKRETLSTELVAGLPTEAGFSEQFRLGGHEVTLAVARLG
jgi:isoleucyl-tRNA synthetase